MTDVTQATRHAAPEARLQDLAKTLARTCKGAVRVTGEDAERMAGLLADRGVDVVDGDACAPQARTLLLMDPRADLDAKELDALWRGLPDDGVLVWCTLNVDAAEGGGATRLEARRLLEPFGKVRILRDAPFRWIAAPVFKGPYINGETRRRLSAIALLCSGRVLELGCGRGHLSAAIAARGAKVTGIELNAEKVEMARRFHPGIEFRQGDILDLPDDLGEFDSVVIAEVLEHVPPEIGRRFIDAAWSRLAAGGRLVVSTPYEDMVPHRNHAVEFTAASLREALSVCGPVRLWDHQPLRWLLATVERDGN